MVRFWPIHRHDAGFVRTFAVPPMPVPAPEQLLRASRLLLTQALVHPLHRRRRHRYQHSNPPIVIWPICALDQLLSIEADCKNAPSSSVDQCSHLLGDYFSLVGHYQAWPPRSPPSKTLCGQKSGKPRSQSDFFPFPLLPETYRDDISRKAKQAYLIGNNHMR